MMDRIFGSSLGFVLAVAFLFAVPAAADYVDDGYFVDGPAYLSTGGGTLSGIVYHPDGTPPLPSVSFANDTDTGIYRSGSNQLGFSAGSVGQAVPRMRLSSSVLDVYGSTVYSSSGPIEIGTACTTGATGGACVGGQLNLAQLTADPCGTYAQGALFFNATDNRLCICIGDADVQVHDATTDCF